MPHTEGPSRRSPRASCHTMTRLGEHVQTNLGSRIGARLPYAIIFGFANFGKRKVNMAEGVTRSAPPTDCKETLTVTVDSRKDRGTAPEPGRGLRCIPCDYEPGSPKGRLFRPGCERVHDKGRRGKEDSPSRRSSDPDGRARPEPHRECRAPKREIGNTVPSLPDPQSSLRDRSPSEPSAEAGSTIVLLSSSILNLIASAAAR